MHKKSRSEYSAQYKRRPKKQIATDIHEALTFTQNNFYSPSRIELVNSESKELLIVKPDGCTVTISPCQQRHLSYANTFCEGKVQRV